MLVLDDGQPRIDWLNGESVSSISSDVIGVKSTIFCNKIILMDVVADEIEELEAISESQSRKSVMKESKLHYTPDYPRTMSDHQRHVW